MRVSYRDLYLISDNLAGLYEDGIPIILSLELLQELPLSREYKKSLSRIKEDVKEGNSLGESFGKNANLYPSFFSGIIEIGENSGELTSTLRRLKSFYFNLAKVRKELKGALRYPAFVLLALLVLMFIFIMIIVPNIYETFKTMDRDVSGPIRVFYDVYAVLKYNKIYSITCIVSVALFCLLVFKFIMSFSKEHKFASLFKTQFLGQYYEYVFIMVLWIIVDSGIQLSRGLRLCIESIDSSLMKVSMEDLFDKVMRGNEIGTSLEGARFLSKYTRAMIAMGEKSGSMSENLNKVSNRLEVSLLEKLERIVSYTTPISIVLLTIFMIGFIFVFIIPMFDMVYSGVM